MSHITIQRAMQDGTNPESLRSVAEWNVRMARRATDAGRVRMLSQAASLDRVANRLEADNDNGGHNVHQLGLSSAVARV